MPLTTKTLVKEIMTTALSDSDIDSMITHASTIVTDKLGTAGLSTALLTEIETWVTAHLIAMTKERQASQEKIGEISVTYQKNPQGFFEMTTYGQTALMLDTSGKLQAAAKKRAWIKATQQDSDNVRSTRDTY